MSHATATARETRRPDDAAIGRLRTQLRGEVVTPGDSAYDTARRVYNAMIDRHPWVIARPVNVGDVMTAVAFGREHGLPIAIRGGGHNGAGLGVCDDGLVIDLSRMRGVRVDPTARTARVDAGCLLGDVDHATAAFGLALPTGIASTTGIAGLTLGGGLGHLTRRFGLTIDNLLEADVVLADGRFVTASATSHPDLFWALRGGGGNFGIVTSFLFRVHPVSTVYGGPMLWTMDRAKEAMQRYREFMRGASDDVSGFFAMMNVPPGPPFPEAMQGKPACGIVWCCTGPREQAEAALRPFRAFGPPGVDFAGPIPVVALQSMFDALLPPGMQWYWKADYVNELTDAAIARHVEHGAALPTPVSQMHLYPIDGAASRVGPRETAWAYRDARFVQVIVGVDPDPVNRDLITRWTRAYFEALHPHSAGGAYVNMMMDEADEGADRIKSTYGDNYDRLARIKAEYDPSNTFRVNQNIRPAATHA